jgi:glycosyltransferase involved in cell wall biosynthesis
MHTFWPTAYTSIQKSLKINKMKILCVIDSLCLGGSQRQIVELALGFKEKGHSVSFLTYHNIVFFDSILINEGIDINCIEEDNYLLRILKMRKFIRKGNYDGIVAFLEGPSFICEVAGLPFKKWKLVISEGSANPNIFKSIRHIVYRVFHFFTDYVVANSHANMKMVRTINPLLSKSKCKVVYNIIDFSRWKPLESYKPKKDGVLKLIVPSRHQYLKNLNGLIDAVLLLSREEQKKLNVLWYGDGVPGDNSLVEGKQRIKDLNMEHIIKLYPGINPITEKIQEADAVGLFSYYEGFPNAVCEGMACRKPILSTNVSDAPELLEYNKNLLCEASDPHSIKKALSYLIALKPEELHKIGCINEEIAQREFDKERNLMGYLELLN